MQANFFGFVSTGLDSFQFLIRNFFNLRRIDNLNIFLHEGIYYRGMQRNEVKQISDLYAQLNTGTNFAMSMQWLYFLLGRKILLVAVKQEGGTEKIVGINMYYLNVRDLKDNTIHEAFIGVLPEMSGLGVATDMRQMAKRHFSNQGFKGLSTRVSLNNTSSLKSALKIGFNPVEKYYDKSLGEDRYYMICDLENK